MSAFCSDGSASACPSAVRCKKCKGSGKHRQGDKCAACLGSGWVQVTKDKDDHTIITPVRP